MSMLINGYVYKCGPQSDVHVALYCMLHDKQGSVFVVLYVCFWVLSCDTETFLPDPGSLMGFFLVAHSNDYIDILCIGEILSVVKTVQNCTHFRVIISAISENIPNKPGTTSGNYYYYYLFETFWNLLCYKFIFLIYSC